MDPAPPPPHERAWRHPSELGPPVHEPAAPTARVLVVAVATFGLVLVGLLVVAVTPDRRDGSSSAVGAGSVPAALTTAVVSSAALHVTDSAWRNPDRTPIGSSGDAVMPMVTPIGDGLGVTTDVAMAGRERVTAELPDGELAEVEVLATDAASGLVVVRLPAEVTAEQYPVSSDPPSDDDVVVLAGSTSVTLAIADIADLSVAEATPVLDDDGNLVGLCTDDGGAIEVTRVDPDLAEWDDGPDDEGHPHDTSAPTSHDVSHDTADVAPPTSDAAAPGTSGPDPTPVSGDDAPSTTG